MPETEADLFHEIEGVVSIVYDDNQAVLVGGTNVRYWLNSHDWVYLFFDGRRFTKYSTGILNHLRIFEGKRINLITVMYRSDIVADHLEWDRGLVDIAAAMRGA